MNMRTNGMSYHRVPLFVWAIYVTAILLLLSLPVLAGFKNMQCRLKIWLIAGITVVTVNLQGNLNFDLLIKGPSETIHQTDT